MNKNNLLVILNVLLLLTCVLPVEARSCKPRPGTTTYVCPSANYSTKYRLTTRVVQGQTEIIELTKVSQNDTVWTWDVRNLTSGLTALNIESVIYSGVASFTLPVFTGARVLTINCTGFVNSALEIKGACVGINKDNVGNLAAFGDNFTAIPIN